VYLVDTGPNLKRENKTFQRDANRLFQAEKEGIKGEKAFFTAKK
jgi:hypothetical protein